MPLDGTGGKSQESPRAEALIDELQDSIIGFELSTDAEQALYAQALALANDVEDEREIRLLENR